MEMQSESTEDALASDAGPGAEPDIVFMYRLIDGRSKNSFGRLCAQLAGVTAPVLQRAAHVSARLEAGFSVEPAGNATTEAAKRRLAAHHRDIVSRFMEFDRERVDSVAFVQSL